MDLNTELNIATLLALVGAIITGAVAWQRLRSQVDENTRNIARNKADSDNLHAAVDAIKELSQKSANDINWIRLFLERKDSAGRQGGSGVTRRREGG